MRFIVSGPLLLACTVSTLGGQSIPVLQATRDLAVEGKNAGLTIHARVIVSPGGTIAVAAPQAEHLVLIDKDMRRVQILGQEGEKPGAINNVGPFGWVGDSLWVSDTHIHRVTLFAPSHAVARIPNMPLTVEGPPGMGFSNPNGLPFILKAIYPGGDLLVEEGSIPGLRPRENSRGYLLRVTPDGAFKAAMGLVYDGWAGCKPPPNDFRTPQIRDFCLGPPSTLSVNGKFLLTVRSNMSGVDSGRYSVTAANEHGDTLFTRSFPFVPVAVSSAELDSAIAWRMGLATQVPRVQPGRTPSKPQPSDQLQRMEAFARSIAGTVHPPVLTLLPGNDGTVWLELFSRELGHHWVELDATGKTIGTLTLPANVVILQGERGTLWGREELADSSINVVRYHVGPISTP